MLRLNQTLLALVLIVTCACRKEDDVAQTKSIDNAVRSSGEALTVNSCGIDMDAKAYAKLTASDRSKLESHIEPVDEATKQLVAGTLLGAPKALHTMFFAAKGTIHVVTDAETVCSGIERSDVEKRFVTEDTSATHGCWDMRSGRLVITVERAHVRHGLVRLLAYVYTQFFARKVATVDGLPELQGLIASGLTRWKNQKTELWHALLGDLAKTHPAARERLVKAAKGNLDEIQDIIVAELIDSAYCSADTAATFKSGFKGTYAAFNDGDSALGRDLGRPFHQSGINLR